jgi:hypothetical protein
MSDKIPIQDTYDFSKSIENISLSTTYIYGLEQLLMYLILKMDNPASLQSTFKKFEDFILGKIELKESTFSEEETHLYTIFSLQQLLKAKAYDQGLNVKINATIDQSLVKDLLEAVANKEFDKISDINKKMQDQLNNQLS